MGISVINSTLAVNSTNNLQILLKECSDAFSKEVGENENIKAMLYL